MTEIKVYGPASLRAVLNGLEERALAASESDRKNGDRWYMNHGFVISDKATICHPTFDKQFTFDMQSHPPSRYINSNDLARHIAGADPQTMLRLVASIRKLLEEQEKLV